MEKTFSHRRLEIVDQKPPIRDFKDRWPALFQESEASATEDAERDIAATVVGIYMIRRDGDGEPEDVGIVIEGKQRPEQCRQCHHGLHHAVWAHLCP
ncbi:hypothetical protein SKAU_G00341610 [Synaphobranchus kaupii]|uniref:Uncharacterized protein n=1 Tax=Synaphobranchus kaupii TaxID=118154 RepID=A0A9Q1EN27_SYNKA|nr:hypothetical protein SKAU_G00341610 [Synaphobranchus kaupii]